MTLHKAMLIPTDLHLPMQMVLVDYEQNIDPTVEFPTVRNDVHSHLFGADSRTGHWEYHTWGGRNTVVYFDENMGMGNLHINPRAMMLWAWLSNREMESFIQPLVGDFLVGGLDEDLAPDVSEWLYGMSVRNNVGGPDAT